jgi:hypothetical protein
MKAGTEYRPLSHHAIAEAVCNRSAIASAAWRLDRRSARMQKLWLQTAWHGPPKMGLAGFVCGGSVAGSQSRRPASPDAGRGR